MDEAKREIGGDARAEKALLTEVVSVELPSPPGWMKKFMPKRAGTPKRNEIIFISPTGEEIKNKKQLDQYLKSHTGGPPASEFDWGTGDSPRRSARLSEKAKALESPESEKPKKRERKSRSKKGAKEENDDGDDPGEPPEAKENTTRGEAKEPADVEMKEADDDMYKIKDEGVAFGIDENASSAVEDGTVNKGAFEHDSKDKTKESVQEKFEYLERDDKLEEASKVDKVASMPEIGKEQDKADGRSSDFEVVAPASELKEADSAENAGEDQDAVLGKDDADSRCKESASCKHQQWGASTQAFPC